MARWAKTLAAEPGSLSLIPGLHMGKEKGKQLSDVII